MAYLLEFVDGYNAGAVGLLQIAEYFIKCIFRLLNVTKTDAEGWSTGDSIEPELAVEASQRFHKPLGHLLPAWHCLLIDRAAQLVYQLLEAGGVQNVDKESVVIPTYHWVVETVLYQPCLAHTAVRLENDIVVVQQKFGQPFRFCLTVAEIFRLYVSCHHKRIFFVSHCSRTFYGGKDMKKNHIMQNELFKLNNST